MECPDPSAGVAPLKQPIREHHHKSLSLMATGGRAIKAVQADRTFLFTSTTQILG
jgi:hypothetical protein